jgi:hypothetical protein
VEEDNCQSKPRLASLITPPSLPDRDAGKQPETPPLMNLVPPVPGELERQPEEHPRPARQVEELNDPETSPRGAESHDEDGGGPAYPPRPVPSDDAGLLPAPPPCPPTWRARNAARAKPSAGPDVGRQDGRTMAITACT